MGVSVKGKIVIARYYHSWRGIKPKVAAEHGAIGCLIYSDPHEDGFVQGETFPQGAWRPKDGVQRGSVADMPFYAGDPLTPGVGATKDAKRLKVEESPTITKIPVLPISYADAQPLLARSHRPRRSRRWRGGLGQTYRIGPGPAKVHLKVKSNWDIKPVYDVIAKIPGSTAPDEWVMRGNHHDAWVNGAEDPISGMDAVLEEARAMSELLKQGWKPKRTIIFCAWDGEEPGLLGSTEYAEEHADELKQHAVAYINSDTNGRGYLFIEGSHTLEKFTNEVSKDITDPETKLSAWKRNQLREIANAHSSEARQEARQRADLRIAALGSGSDYTAFLQHDGVASVNLGFGGEDGGGIYHSIYDDFYWYTHFSDTDFVYGRALAQTGGTMVMRLADADLLPFEFNDFSDTIQTYIKELKALATKITRRRARTQSRNRRRRLHRDHRSEGAARRAARRNRAHISKFRAARQRRRHPRSQRRRISQSLRTRDRQRQHRARVRLAHRSERAPHRKRAQTSHRRRPTESPLVQASDLRPRLLHRLRRQNDPRRPRSHRTQNNGSKPTKPSSSSAKCCNPSPN